MTARKHGVEIYDTTLRDGAQTIGVSFSVADKIAVIRKLDELGLDFIEAGHPASNDKDREFFDRAKTLELRHAALAAFGTTCHKGKTPEGDADLATLAKVGTEVVTLVGKSSRFQVCQVLKTDAQENIRMIGESCAWLVSKGKQVFFDAEHFFDGYKEDSDYVFKILFAAVDSGVTRIILCDTNGGTLYPEIGQIVSQVKKEIKIPLGIHAHNDAGLAVANSLAAVEHGVIQVQGTINGYGERCGNADLVAVIANLQLKKGYSGLSSEQLARLTEVSRFVADVANLAPNPFQPYAGHSAFCHKGGLHIDGHKKHPEAYQHIKPELVGNRSDDVVSDLAGKASIKAKAQKFGIDLALDEAEKILGKVKILEAQGFQFETAEASLELLIRRWKGGYVVPFEILHREVLSEEEKGQSPKDRAMLRVKINGGKKGRGSQYIAESKEGPVDALGRAIRRALRPYYGRAIKDVKLVDYKVRTVSAIKGTRSSVRVLIDFSDGKKEWTAVGASRDIIGASCQALTDGYEYAILKAR